MFMPARTRVVEDAEGEREALTIYLCLPPPSGP